MRHILVVDDDPQIRIAVRAWLERYGFRVSIADDGVNGRAAPDNGTFDLTIVDIFMPNMHGFESIRGGIAGRSGIAQRVEGGAAFCGVSR